EEVPLRDRPVVVAVAPDGLADDVAHRAQQREHGVEEEHGADGGERAGGPLQLPHHLDELLALRRREELPEVAGHRQERVRLPEHEAEDAHAEEDQREQRRDDLERDGLAPDRHRGREQPLDQPPDVVPGHAERGAEPSAGLVGEHGGGGGALADAVYTREGRGDPPFEKGGMGERGNGRRCTASVDRLQVCLTTWVTLTASPGLTRPRRLMPWTITDPMLQRAALLADFERGLYSIAELARRYGVSRKTAHKWIGRWQSGDRSTDDRSRAPLSCPHAHDEVVREAVLDLRRRHRTWGPRKLVVVLARERPD